MEIAVFLISAFVLAGCAQVAWLATRWSRAWSIPIDGGRTLRGRRIFGDNKTMRGFVVMIPAAAIAFVLLAQLVGWRHLDAAGLWPLDPAGYAVLGACAGFGFMAGELPNSFVKRQLDVAPGALTSQPIGRILQLVFDRLDSGIGMLTATNLLVPVPLMTWAIVLLAGPALHFFFSVWLFRLRVKPRAA